MEDALMEAKAALAKSKDEMAKYYDRRRTPAPVYQPRDKVYLDASDIQMTRPSQKLSGDIPSCMYPFIYPIHHS